MNILVITDLYPICKEEKFTPKTIYDFVNVWKKQGHNVRVLKPNFLFNSFIRKKPYYKTGFYNDIENVNYFLPFLGNIRKKIKTLDNFSPDIVFAHMPSGLITANKLGLPFVAAVHVSDIEVLTSPIYSVYFKTELLKAYKNASKIACRSEVLKNKFLNLYPEFESKTFVCYSGVDRQYITKREWNYRRKILTCANLIKRKNVDKVIIECSKSNVELTVIGTGKELNNLKRLAKQLKYENIFFTGYLTHDRVLEKMRESDIFMLPSKNETFGLVYLEAMASGCITVCAENEAVAGIIQNGINGYYWKDGIIQDIINSDCQNKILTESYNTILNYTREAAAENYLNNVVL